MVTARPARQRGHHHRLGLVASDKAFSSQLCRAGGGAAPAWRLLTRPWSRTISVCTACTANRWESWGAVSMSKTDTVPSALASVFQSWILLVLVSLVKNFSAAEEEGASVPPPPVFAAPWGALAGAPPQEPMASGILIQDRRIRVNRGLEIPRQVSINHRASCLEDFVAGANDCLFAKEPLNQSPNMIFQRQGAKSVKGLLAQNPRFALRRCGESHLFRGSLTYGNSH